MAVPSNYRGYKRIFIQNLTSAFNTKDLQDLILIPFSLTLKNS